MSIISTERLSLRPFLEKDVAGVLSYLRNSRVSCFKDQQLSATEDTCVYAVLKKEWSK